MIKTISLPILLSCLGLAEPSASQVDVLTIGTRQAQELAVDSKSFTRLPVNWKVRDEDKEKAKKAWDILLSENKGAPKSERKVYMVYVTFSDRPALPDVEERYDHMLKNIQAYYADQMKENGYPPLTFALDLDKQGKMIVHYAHVDQPSTEMTVNSSGPVSRDAAKKVLAEKGIDIEHNHVLVVCQLEDGVGPYYGGGYFKNGTSWTCDQAGLDPRNFLSKEYFGGRYKQTVGGNATIYIGGTAHELGHSFGLPHTREGVEYPDSGRSLMGSGNHTYAQELRNESKGSFLAPTDALMIASVPLFNGMETSAKKRYVSDGEYSDVSITPLEDGAVIKGKISSPVTCYGVIVHLDPPGNRDYDATASFDVPDRDGNFSIRVSRPDFKGNLEMRITSLYTDGSKRIMSVPASLTDRGLESPELIKRVYFGKVQAMWEQGKTEDAAKALEDILVKYLNVDAVRRGASDWIKALSAMHTQGEFEFSPNQVPSMLQKVSLVDCRYTDVKTGWGKPWFDVMIPSKLGPEAYLTAIGKVHRFVLLHAAGHIRYNLDGKWKRFQARLGQVCGKGGSVQFEVYLNDQLAKKTGILKEGESEEVDLDVQGTSQLKIRVLDGGDGNAGDWAVIANPVLSR